MTGFEAARGAGSEMAGLKITRLPGESWRDCASRYGRKYGLEREVLDEFDKNIAAGDPEDDAAHAACFDWDVCELAS